MKFYLSTVLALLVATTSVSAACQRRRSIFSTTDISNDALNVEETTTTPEKLVRRDKSGRRLRRDGPRAGSPGTPHYFAPFPLDDLVLTLFAPLGNAPNLPQNQSDRLAPSNLHSGGSSGNNSSRSTPSSMTSAAGSQQSSSKIQGVRSSSSSKAAAQSSKTSTGSSSSSTSNSSSSSSSGSTYNGQATFYYREHLFPRNLILPLLEPCSLVLTFRSTMY